MSLTEFFAKHDLSRVEVLSSPMHGDFRAFRVGNNPIRDSLYGAGDTPEAALSDLIAKVNAGARPVAPAPVAAPPVDDLDDLLG